ncbi:hypothetical protein GCM10011529_11810 [Polymorphobacter glacialis]|uniref:DUF3011 domain-containing protein n=1 Tax=Sandarakinorhabdus glacialis TaxID=1614636 RepID=A0A916ZQW8_9SPHN|nr:hypothetical protein GCM10011529_11810 [Polymorphobacter glacialis]
MSRRRRPSARRPAPENQRIRCESRNYQPAACSVPGALVARVVQQLGGQCIQGQTWGFNRKGVFVSDGCRAVFDVTVNGYGGGNGSGPGYPGPGYPGGGYPGGGNSARTIRCESQDYRQVRCPVDTRGGVQLGRVLGNTPCRQGQSWGFDRGGVWVNGGCRAEFLVGDNTAGGGYPGGGYPGAGGPSRTITCGSMNYRPARCPIAGANSVRINQVIGGECIQGRSWGYDRDGVWVNNGCRARFIAN